MLTTALRRRPGTAFLAALFVSLAFAGAAASNASAQTAVAKVALVNPARVFNDIQETKDLKSKMESDRKTLESTELEKRQKLKDLQAQRDTLKSDSPQYADLNKQLMQASVDFEVWGRMQQAEFQRTQKMQMKTIFEKIAAATSEVAAARGIDLVIAEQRVDLPDNLDQLNVDQVRALINQRNVLYSSASVDLSSEVVAAMDAKYKSGK